MSERSPRKQALRRVATASYVGSLIEFYDFFIYGTAAALVFPAVFFPHLSHVAATVASMGTFASAFVARPVGAAAFGYVGDRIGRKRALVITLLMMGLSTIGVGLIPSAATIGGGAALLLISLRLVQGLALGGEWAGSALLSTEHAPPGRRGFYGMFTQLGLGSALVLANLVFLAVYGSFGGPDSAFMTWGWRIPFLVSAVLLGVAFAVRVRVEETPAFIRHGTLSPAATSEPNTVGTAVPAAELLREQRSQLFLVSGAVLGMLALVYETGTFFTHYASAHLGYSITLVLLVGVLGGSCTVIAVAVSATRSDAIGRKPIILIGYAIALPWCLLILPLIETGSKAVFASTIMATYVIIGITMGPMASFIPETFPSRYRYTATGLSYNAGGIIGGGIPPIVSEYLLSNYGSWSIGLMLGGLAAISLVCVHALGETVGTDVLR